MDESGRSRTFRRDGARFLALVLAIAENGPALAGAMPPPAPGLAASHADRALIPAASLLTFGVKDIEAEAGSETPIVLTLPTAAELRDAGADKGTFLLIRNIPEGISISPGMATGRIRVVPLREASALRLVSKPGMNAQFQLGFHLIGPGNRVLAETTIIVNLHPRADAAAAAPKLKPSEPTAAVQSLPKAQTLTPQAESVLLARGKDVLQQGGIAAARIIFEELATHGSAAGALALARTYDPAYVTPSAATPTPNLTEASRWYERAAELGNPDAKRRLSEIASGK